MNDELEVEDLIDNIQSYINNFPELVKEFFIYNEDYIVSLITTQLQTGNADVQLGESLDYAESTAKRKQKYPKNSIDSITDFITLYSTGEMQSDASYEVGGDMNSFGGEFISNVSYFDNIKARTGESAFFLNEVNFYNINLMLNDFLTDKLNDAIDGN